MNRELHFPEAHSYKQRLIIDAFNDPDIKEIWVACGSKFGKAQPIDEQIPTPNGMKYMGDLKAGDLIFDENGQPIEIEYATPIQYGRDVYKIIFSDNSTTRADADHLWVTQTHSDRKNEARGLKSGKARIRTTKEIFETCLYKGRPNHSIPLVSNAVEFSYKELPIDPYTLGVWLGDGTRNTTQITKDDRDIEIIERIRTSGYVVNKLSTIGTWSVVGLSKLLSEIGILSEKSVPERYLFASVEQRLALLQGLMDTDGTVDKRGNCSFDNTNKNIADAVYFLANSFGIKVNRAERIGKLYGKEHKKCYRLWWTSEVPVFSLKRKLERIKKVKSKSTRRYITNVEKIDSVPVRCIKVKSETQLYLCTNNFIVTHNTVSGSVGITSRLMTRKGALGRWIAPVYSQAKIGFKYCRKILPNSNEIDINKSEPSIVIVPNDTRLEFRSGKYPEDLEGEATDVNVLDEAAKASQQVYDSVKTTTTVTRGLIASLSTPRGKNWFYVKCMDAKAMMLHDLKMGRKPTHLFITAPSSENPYVTAAAVEEARRALPDRLFRQYFMAEFLDDGSVFIGYQDCVEAGPVLQFDGKHQRWFHPDAETAPVVIGADWAKTHDRTVFTAIDLRTRRIVGFQRFYKTPYTQAIKQLDVFAKKFHDVVACLHDKTGLGQVIDDYLAQTDLPFEGVTFSNQSKNAMVTQLITGIEQQDIWLPNWPEMLAELDAYEVTTTLAGNLTYSAPEGKHDDIVSSLMLAYRGLIQYGDTDMEVKTITSEKAQSERKSETSNGEDPDMKVSALERFYIDLKEDLELDD